jgi:hypothetical protein
MDINLKIKFSTDTERWLCFRHAVQAALRGEDVKTEIDDFDSEYYCGSTWCAPCSDEAQATSKKKK